MLPKGCHAIIKRDTFEMDQFWTLVTKDGGTFKVKGNKLNNQSVEVLDTFTDNSKLYWVYIPKLNGYRYIPEQYLVRFN